jgi:hypothetical protein
MNSENEDAYYNTHNSGYKSDSSAVPFTGDCSTYHIALQALSACHRFRSLVQLVLTVDRSHITHTSTNAV